MSLSLSPAQWLRIVVVLACLHVLVIAASNYLVQLPFTLFGWHTTWGAFSFPFIFLVSDLTVRLLGGATARRVVASAMGPALIVSYLFSVLYVDGRFAGFESLTEFNTLVARIALASFCAYLFGQLLDIGVFQRLRTLRQWWVAPTTSTVFGNALDTLLFFSIAFAGSSNTFMAENWLEIACVDYVFKLLISLCLFLPLYGALLALLSRYLLTATAGTPSRAYRFSR